MNKSKTIMVFILILIIVGTTGTVLYMNSSHPIFVEMDSTCPPCENCVSDKEKKVIRSDGKEDREVCYECLFNDHCKKGFHCFNNVCINNNVLIDNPSCQDDRDACDKYYCEGCKNEYMSCKGGWSDWPSEMQYRCVECEDSFPKCKDGYECKKYECVPK